MTSKIVPVYRHGRKFYVSAEEYERLRSEDRRQRQNPTLKTQHSPGSYSHQASARSASTSSYNRVQRSHSNPYEYKYGVLRTPHLPANSLFNTSQRRVPHRPSRSTAHKYDEHDDLSSLTSSFATKIRSTSSDRARDLPQTPLLSDSDSDIRRSSSVEMSQLSPPQQKPKQQPPIPTRRSAPRPNPDYGISPTTTFSMTPNDQTQTHTNRSKIRSYLARVKQSSLNPPSQASASAHSGAGSFFESGVQGSDNVYTVLGSSNQRTGTTASSLLARSSSESSPNNSYQRDTFGGSSFSDENSHSLLTMIQRRNTELSRSRRTDYASDVEGDANQQRELWTRSTIRSQSSDGLTEKKRVRFADMEGLTLETIPNGNKLNSPVDNRLFIRRPHVNVSSDSRGQTRPFHNALYQAATQVNGNKLATDV